MKERLQDLINYLVAIRAIENKADFCQKVGLGKSFLSDLLSGRSRITKRTCERISQCFANVSADWLMTGEGTMLGDAAVQPQEKQLDMVATLLDMVNTVMKRCDALEKRCDELTNLLLASGKSPRSGSESLYPKMPKGDTNVHAGAPRTDGRDVRPPVRQ